MDFVTIVYNDQKEINLLKLQAISFKYVDPTLINNIYVVYNDAGEFDIEYIRTFYPDICKAKVKLLKNTDIDPVFASDKSSWFNQQALKLLVANHVESDHYLILDGKNHFIRPIVYSDYFKDDKPRLFSADPGPMIQYYDRCLSYFNISCPFNHVTKLVTTTPYLMKKCDAVEIIHYIETQENTPFYTFFMKDHKNVYSEFYLYSTYLIFSKKIQNYEISNSNCCCIMSSTTKDWNSYENTGLTTIKNNSIKIFGLHRNIIPKLDELYKQNLIEFYKNYYDEVTVEFIKSSILYT